MNLRKPSSDLCMCALEYIYLHTYIHTHIHTYRHTHTHVHTYTLTYTHIHIYPYIGARIPNLSPHACTAGLYIQSHLSSYSLYALVGSSFVVSYRHTICIADCKHLQTKSPLTQSLGLGPARKNERPKT